MRYIFYILLISGSGCGRSGEELVIFVAASAEGAVREVADGFEEREGVRVLLHAGGSTGLRSQILRGAPADVYVAAGPVNLPGEPEVVAVNRVVAVVPAGSLAKTWRNSGRIAIADPALAPAGVYARRILEREGVLTEQIHGGHVRAVLAYVELGLVDAGFVYRSDVSSRVRIVETFPDHVSYEAIAVSDRKLARRFLSYLVQKRDVFRKRGFE